MGFLSYLDIASLTDKYLGKETFRLGNAAIANRSNPSQLAVSAACTRVVARSRAMPLFIDSLRAVIMTAWRLEVLHLSQ